MRRILIASALLSPMLFTAAAVASQPKDDASASTLVRPISTGVTAPKIVHSTDIQITPETARSIMPNAEVVLKVNLDEQGKAQDVQVIKSANPILDAPVISAVRQFRWSPATLDKQAIPVDLTLSVVVQH
jgi:TonB family protein